MDKRREISEKQFLGVIEKLRRLKGAPRVAITLCPVANAGDDFGLSRGILNHDQPYPKERLTQGPMPTSVTPQVLRVGEWFRIAFRSPVAGRLYLFNLGLGGSVARLAPQDGAQAGLLESETLMGLDEMRNPVVDMTVWESFQVTCGRPEDLQYLERLLVVVDRTSRNGLDSRSFCADWSPRTRSGGFGRLPSQTQEEFWSRPIDSYEYGLLQLPVELGGRP